jgi:hypothetical protein
VNIASDAPAWVQRAKRTADSGVVDVSRALSVSPSAPRINAQRVARFDSYNADFRGAKFYNNLGGDGAVLAQKIG